MDVTTLSELELQKLLATGELSASTVTAAYLQRIAELDAQGPMLNAIIQVNPDAARIATELDEAFSRSGPLGPLHGLPVVLKANIDTGDEMATSAGSLALADHMATADAHLVTALRGAGAVIIGKSNLSEWANFRDSNSSSGWSSLGGQTRNPYVLDRNPCGSSSGSAVAVAAALAPLAVGTETNGSIVCPAGVNGVVGIKPTVGLVSRTGILPISHTQDTAGPMARSVAGAALLLQSLVDYDSSDAGAIRLSADPAALLPDTTRTDLKGRRIGILRTYQGVGTRPRVEAIYQQAVERLEVLGAALVDPVEYRSTSAMRGASYRVLLHEFKAGLNAYLTAHELPEHLNSLSDLIVYNRARQERVMPFFGQSIFLDAEASTGLEDSDYLESKSASQDQLRSDIDSLFATQQLDALFLPVNGPAWKTDWINGDQSGYGSTAYLAAITGYPSIVLPAGAVNGLPVAVGFMGLAQTDAELIQMAYALEQSLPELPLPEYLPTLEQP